MTPTAADELDVLFAAPVPVAAGGEQLYVRGVVLDELPAFLRLYARQPADDAALDAIDGDAWATDFVALMAPLCDRTPEWLWALPEPDIERVMDATRRANRILFDAPALRHGPRNSRGASWANAVAQLVECGHALEAVRRYTLAQIEMLCAAHARLAADRRIDELAIARAAQADMKGYKRALAALEKARATLG